MSWVSLWCWACGRNLASSSANKLLFCCRVSVNRRSSEDVVILKFDVASLSETIYKCCMSEYYFRIGKMFRKKRAHFIWRVIWLEVCSRKLFYTRFVLSQHPYSFTYQGSIAKFIILITSVCTVDSNLSAEFNSWLTK